MHCSVWTWLAVMVVGAAAACTTDTDCPAGDCCSQHGYCGTGAGYCSQQGPGPGRVGRQRAGAEGAARAGAGCVLENTEWVGGDLPVLVGGGGLRLERNTSEACYTRCEENPGCRWYTWDQVQLLDRLGLVLPKVTICIIMLK